jgi:hypothetical protein
LSTGTRRPIIKGESPIMQSLRRGRYGMLAVGSLVLSGLGAAGAFAAEPTPTSTIKDGSDWVAQAYENTANGVDLTPKQSDAPGPQRAPYTTSSHRIVIGESTVQTELYRTKAYDGTALASVTRLEYSTFARRTNGTGADRQPTYLRLNVDNDNDGNRDASLFFFPANNASQQVVKNDVWQDWDVDSGKISVDGDSGPAATTTLAEYAAAHPGSKLVNNNAGQANGGALALINGGADGGPNDNQINGEYFVDRVIVGKAGQDTLYDFGGNIEKTGAVSTTVVGPRHLAGWVQQSFDGNTNADLTSNQKFVTGPATPPRGDGSLRFQLSDGTNPNRVEQFRTPAYDGALLRDVRQLDYSTFQKANSGNTTPQQPVYLRLNIDNDGDGARDESLFYFPANNGTVQQRTWQTWDADGGKWSIDGDGGPATAVTLDNYLVAHPDAVIVNNADGAPAGGGVTFQVGAGGAGQTNGRYYLDNIRMTKVDAATGATETGTRFDLEPTHVDLTLSQATKHRVRVHVATLPATPGATVKVYRVTKSGPSRVLKDELNARGRITRVLADQYKPGAKLKFFVKVTVDGNTYKSDRETITIK